MLITTQQISAARALLEWNQKELANRAGLTVDYIHRIESGRSKSSETLDAIFKVFTAAGIVFTRYGVELRPSVVSIIEGEGWYLRLLEDVYGSLAGLSSPELLLFCADDKVSPPDVNAMYRKIRDAGGRMRQLVQEGNTYLMGPVEEYRYIPKENFENYVSMVYGDKVAVCTDDNTKAMVFKDAHLAAAWRNIFNVMWARLEQPKRSNADERF